MTSTRKNVGTSSSPSKKNSSIRSPPAYIPLDAITSSGCHTYCSHRAVIETAASASTAAYPAATQRNCTRKDDADDDDDDPKPNKDEAVFMPKFYRAAHGSEWHGE